MNKVKSFFKNEAQDYKMLFRSIPSWLILLFVCSVIFMNLFANKELGLNVDWLALDCGFFLSWIYFLCMDMVVKRFGAKASIKVALFALIINLLFALICFLISLLPGNWGAFYDYENGIVNDALNSTIGGTWYVLMGSSIAFIVSSVINAILNQFIGKHLKKQNFINFAIRSFASTLLGQFIDNILFAEIVSAVFFGWSQLQCITCALTGAIAELLFEIVFSGIGYKVVKYWDKEGVGKEYLEYANKA